MGFFRKAIDSISHPTHSRTFGLLIGLILLLTLSLTVIMSQKQQRLRQRASADLLETCKNGCYEAELEGGPDYPTDTCLAACDQQYLTIPSSPTPTETPPPTEELVQPTPTPTEKSSLVPPLTFSSSEIRLTSVTPQGPIYLKEGDKTTIHIGLRNFSNVSKNFSCNLQRGAFVSHRCSTENLNDYWHLNVDMDGELVSRIFKYLLLQPDESKVVTYTFDSKNVSPGQHELKVYLSYLPEDSRSITFFIESAKPISTPVPTIPIQRPTPTLTSYPCIANCMDTANYSYCRVDGVYNRLNRTVDCDSAYSRCYSSCDVSVPTPTPITLAPTATPVPISTPLPTLPTKACPLRSRGDANCDGKVDIRDYNIWLNAVSSISIDPEYNPDFNNDGKIDIRDYNKWLEGISSP